MRSQVFQINSSTFASSLAGLVGTPRAGGRVLLKVHMGQPDLGSFLSPLCAALRDFGWKPTCCDSGIALSSLRGKHNLDTLVESFIPFRVAIDEATGASALDEEWELVLNIAHITGHTFCGYSAALNNIALGFMTAERRLRLHAKAGSIMVTSSLCNGCTSAAKPVCIQNCRQNAISVIATNGGYKALVDPQRCTTCVHCLACPQGVFSAEEQTVSKFLDFVLEQLVEQLRPGRPILHINYGMAVTAFCDCIEGLDISKAVDLPSMASWDAVALEQATIEVLLEEGGIVRINVEPVRRLLRACERMHIGTRQYSLIRLDGRESETSYHSNHRTGFCATTAR